MKKFTLLVLLSFCAIFIGNYHSLAQTSDISPDPAFNKSRHVDTSVNKRIKAKEHNGAFAYNYAKDVAFANKLRKIFTVEIDESGEYYLSAYVNAVYDVPDKPDAEMRGRKYPLQEIAVYIDNEPVGNLDISESGWCSARLKTTKKIKLSTGNHEVVFESDMPNTPNIDVIKLSKSYENALFNNTVYEQYLDELRTNMDKNKDNTKKITQKEIDDAVQKEANLKSASNPNSEWEVTSYTLDDGDGEGEGSYAHKMNVPVVYTYYQKIYFTAGTSVEFATAVNIPYTTTAVDPVMYLFSEDNHNYAWSDDDSGSGYQSIISVTIPVSGYYYLVVRAYSNSYASTTSGMQGVVDIYKNGVLYQDDVPVSGYQISCGTSNEGLLNYFTAYSTGTPKLWLMVGGATSPIEFHGSTFWYVSPMNYNWFDDARFRIVKSGDSYMSLNLLVSSEYAWYIYWGNCDLYGSVKDYGDHLDPSYFPNLLANDAMETAKSTATYNCGSWAGGLTTGWFWGKLYQSRTDPTVIGLSWYGDGTPQNFDTWEDYFMNSPFPRYTGALYYSSYGANSTNGDIALFEGREPIFNEDGEIIGSNTVITHFSVRKEANKQAHGYDWESKPGQNARVFHPKDALNNSDYYAYGEITQYYREVPEPQIEKSTVTANSNDGRIHSFEESVELGLTVPQTVYLTQEEEKLLDNLNSKLKSGNNTLETLFNSWQNKCKSEEYKYNSNPFKFFDNEECNKLAKYCINHKETALPYLISKTFAGSGDGFENQMTAILFSGITGKSHGKLMDEVKEEWKSNNYNEDGAYIAPSELANSKNYMKKFLSKEYSLNDDKVTGIEVLENSHENYSIYPNPMSVRCNVRFTMPEDSKITIALYKDAQLVRYLVNNRLFPKGEHNLTIDRNSLSSGMYVCKLVINNKTLARKILVL